MPVTLGCGTRNDFDQKNAITKARYHHDEHPDVDGAHRRFSVFLPRDMPGLIEGGNLFLALPTTLYRLSSNGGAVAYARDDAHREEIMKTIFDGEQKVEVSRFKELGEMPAHSLRGPMNCKRGRTSDSYSR